MIIDDQDADELAVSHTPMMTGVCGYERNRRSCLQLQADQMCEERAWFATSKWGAGAG
jgi:hypothetical protein